MSKVLTAEINEKVNDHLLEESELEYESDGEEFGPLMSSEDEDENAQIMYEIPKPVESEDERDSTNDDNDEEELPYDTNNEFSADEEDYEENDNVENNLEEFQDGQQEEQHNYEEDGPEFEEEEEEEQYLIDQYENNEDNEDNIENYEEKNEKYSDNDINSDNDSESKTYNDEELDQEVGEKHESDWLDKPETIDDNIAENNETDTEVKDRGINDTMDPLRQIPVYLDIGNDVVKLFPPQCTEDSMFTDLPLLFNNTDIIDQPIGEIFDTFKLYTSTYEDIVVFKIPTLSNLTIRSDSIECRTLTLANILEVFDLLKQQDEETYKFVQIEVSKEIGLSSHLKGIKKSALLSLNERKIKRQSESNFGPENKKVKY